ncbi:MAG: FecR domain-containing protein [Pseudomonadota bacterium]
MTAETMSAEERASKEATDWLILLQEEPDDPSLLSRFERWLGDSPVNAAAWATTQKTVRAIGVAQPQTSDAWASFVAESRAADVLQQQPQTDAAVANTARSPGQRRDVAVRRDQPTRRRKLGLRVATLAIAACIAILAVPSIVLRLEADHITGSSEVTTIALADGSAVTMAPDSAITVTYDDTGRDVRLLAGEAFFDVVSDADRPFRVTTRDVQATVLGTQFNVRSDNDEAEIAVAYGVVRVDNDRVTPPVSETLAAGQRVRVTWNGNVIRSDIPAVQIAAWRQNQLVAQDQPMGEVVDRLRPFFDGTIIVTDGAFAELPVTGVYNLADPVDALRGLAHTHGASVHQITPWILVVSAP